MADVIGPGKKPGQTLTWKPDGRTCDECEEVAQHHIVGESDSFGSETMHLCNFHAAELRREELEKRNGFQYCEICHEQHQQVIPFRDPAEGGCGPVYMACPSCRTRIIEDFVGDDVDETPTYPN